MVLLTHPEYWTAAMRYHLQDFIAAGGSLIYLGGNGLSEKCGLSEDGLANTFFDGSPTFDRRAAYFRNQTPPWPERSLLGVAFKFDPHWHADPDTHTTEPYRVINATHPFMQPLRLEAGALIGQGGRNGGNACGWEVDTSTAPAVDIDGHVDARGSSDRGLPPANLVVLAQGASGPYRHAADMTCYETKAGGVIFSVGSICFGGSLVEDPRLARLLENVLEHVVRGGSR